jgi:hypothetical protein
LITLAGSASPVTGAMPESISATPMPLAVILLPAESDFAHTVGAPAAEATL